MLKLLAAVAFVAMLVPPAANELVAAKVSKLPTIDGKADDEAWKTAKEVVVKTTPYDYYIEKIQDDIKYWKRDMRAAKRDISAARARLEKYAEQVSNAEETLNVLLKVAAMYEPGP